MSTNDDEEQTAPLSPEEEAVLKEELDAALAVYGKLAPPELLELMRAIGTDAGRNHPVTRRLLTAAAARRVPQQSADLPKGGGRPGTGKAGDGEGS